MRLGLLLPLICLALGCRNGAAPATDQPVAAMERLKTVTLPNLNIVSEGEPYLELQVPESVAVEAGKLVTSSGARIDLFMGRNAKDEAGEMKSLLSKLQRGVPLEGAESVIKEGRWLVAATGQ